jgi:hypothetical protein
MAPPSQDGWQLQRNFAITVDTIMAHSHEHTQIEVLSEWWLAVLRDMRTQLKDNMCSWTAKTTKVRCKFRPAGYVDGRADPIAAPRAVASFLTWLKDEFEGYFQHLAPHLLH